MDARVPPQGARLLLRAPDADLGRRTVGEIDFESIFYYIKPTENQVDKWEDLPADILDTWDKLGIPEAEKKYLAGVGAQYESEVVYHKLQEDLEKKGVIFLDMELCERDPVGVCRGVVCDDGADAAHRIGCRNSSDAFFHVIAAASSSGTPDRGAGASSIACVSGHDESACG